MGGTGAARLSVLRYYFDFGEDEVAEAGEEVRGVGAGVDTVGATGLGVTVAEQ